MAHNISNQSRKGRGKRRQRETEMDRDIERWTQRQSDRVRESATRRETDIEKEKERHRDTGRRETFAGAPESKVNRRPPQTRGKFPVLWNISETINTPMLWVYNLGLC